MVKKYKATIILTSIITLLPMLAGILLWPRLPESVATHFGWDGAANGWSSKGFAVFGLPLILLAAHLICAVVTANDPKRKNIAGKMYGLVLWICPLTSLICAVCIYGYMLDIQLDVWLWSSVLEGVLLIVVGNYLPKCRQNYTVGIKLPWTLADEENWNKTHRLAGWVWVIGGVVVLLNALFRIETLFLAVLLLVIGIPTIYSFALYRKKRQGE